jgi:hypothetical protein
LQISIAHAGGAGVSLIILQGLKIGGFKRANNKANAFENI